MSLSINSDLIMGVVNAANPAKVASAKGKLKIGARGTIADNKFQVLVDKRFGQTTKVKNLAPDLIVGVLDSADQVRKEAAIQSLGGESTEMAALDTSLQNSPVIKFKNSKSGIQNQSHVNNQKFEALVLRNFVEDVLPKATSGVYGEGTAGDIWRSMEADFISQDMAKAGGIGIADQLDSKDSKKTVIQPHKEYSFSSRNNTTPAAEIVADRTWPYFKMLSS
jgi:Rod binding domain-containing protein